MIEKESKQDETPDPAVQTLQLQASKVSIKDQGISITKAEDLFNINLSKIDENLGATDEPLKPLKTESNDAPLDLTKIEDQMNPSRFFNINITPEEERSELEHLKLPKLPALGAIEQSKEEKKQLLSDLNDLDGLTDMQIG